MILIAMVAKRRNFPVEPPIPLRELPRVTWEAFPALLMPVILLVCLYSGATTPTEAAAAAAMYSLLVSAFLYRTMSAARHLPVAARQRARHGFHRHADRGRDGLQLRDHGGEHSEGACRDAEGRGALAVRVPPARQHPAAGPRLRPGGDDDPARLRPRPPAHRACPRHRPGALRGDGGRQRHDRAVLAALRPAAAHDGQDHGRAAQGHREGNDSVPRLP